MTHKPGKAPIDKHLVELRREGIEALRRFNGTTARLNFYKRYLALSQYYDVRLAGPFLVIQGGKPEQNIKQLLGETDREVPPNQERGMLLPNPQT